MELPGQEDSMDQPIAIDLSRKKRRKRIIFVKTTRTPSRNGSNPALAQTSSGDTRIEETITGPPLAPTAITPRPKQGSYVSPSKKRNSPKRPILVATKMPKYSAEKRFLGKALSPLKSPTKGVVDDSSGQVVERRILGTADDYVDMFQEENPGVPLGFDVSRIGLASSLGSPPGPGSASAPEPGSSDRDNNSAAVTIDSDEQSRAIAAKIALANTGDAKQMQEMVAAETVAANRSSDPYRYRLESGVLRAARRARIADARSRERAEEEEDESDMLVCDRVVEQREAHALRNWKQMQITWSKAKKVLAKKLKKHPDDLVLSRAEEFREKREEYDLIDNATPFHLKHGSEYWMMSLRGMGTRFVPVGNIFSGLFCPVHEDKVSEPLVIRAPGVRVPLNERTDQPKNWRDAKTLVEKQRTMRKRIDNLRPHIVDTAESNALMAVGVDLFDWAEQTSTSYYRRMDVENGASSSKQVGFAEEEVEEKAQEEEVQKEEVKQQGPGLEIFIPGQPPRDVENGTPMRLLLETQVGKETLKNIDVRNIGTTALYITMRKEDNVTNALSALRGNEASRKSRIHCHKQTFVILPGHHMQIPFSFTSNIPVVYSETWSLDVTPSMEVGGRTSIVIRAVTIEEDQGSTRRALLEERIAVQVAERMAAKDAELALANAPPPMLSDNEKREQEAKVFDKSNAERFGGLPLYYTETVYTQLCALSQKVGGVPFENDGTISTLSASIEAILDVEERDSMRAEMRSLEEISLVPVPSSTSSTSWVAAYTLLMEVALSIPDTSDAIRTEKGLEVADTWVRPRNLRDGKREEVPVERRCDQICKGWTNKKRSSVTGEDGSAPPADDAVVETENDTPSTPEGQYLQAMWSAVSAKLLDGIGTFVDASSSSFVTKRDSSRQDRQMLLKAKYRLWSKLPDEDEEEEETDETEETENIVPEGGEKGDDAAVISSEMISAAHVTASVNNFLASVSDARVLVRLDTSGLVYDTDNGVRVLSDESPTTELQLQRAVECVQQLLRANAGAIILTGTNSHEETFKPFADALSETMDRPVRFVGADEDVFPIIESFEEKRRVKMEAKAERARKLGEKKAAAEARRQARLEAGGDDEEEDDEEEDEDDEEEEDEDEEGTCPVILLENRALCPCERLAYRAELHELAEEEDVDERNQEMDAYANQLRGMCDLFINDDLIGSSTNNVTVSNLASKKNLYGAGPRMQFELSVLEQLVQDIPRPAFGIVGGTSLREKLSLLDALLDVLDEIMLGASLSPMFERVKREMWFIEHPREEELVQEQTQEVADEDVPSSDKQNDVEVGAEDNEADKNDEVDDAATAPSFVVLTAEEDSLLPAVRHLVKKALGRGVIFHTCMDYIVGDLPPTQPNGSGNYDVEYNGEVSEFNVKLLEDPTTQVSSEEGEDAEVVEGGGDGAEEDEEEEEEEEEEEGERLPPNDPRVVRELHGMPPSNSYVLDIGPMTQEAWAKELSRAKSVMWLDPVGSVAHSDFAAGSQALLEALMPEDEEEEAAAGGGDETSTTNEIGRKRLVAMFGNNLVGALRAGGMADEDLTLVSSGNAQTMEEFLGGCTPGVQKLSEIPPLPVPKEVKDDEMTAEERSME